METNAKKPLLTESIKDFVTKRLFNSIVPVVRENENKYPYITFIDKDNKAENVYFSKSASKHVAAGQPVTKEMLAAHQVGYTTNEAGEERIKLISNSERVAIESLLD